MRALTASLMLLVFVACTSTSPPAMPMNDESEDTPPSVPQPQAVDPRIFATTEQPVVYADSKIDGYEQIEPALSVEEKAAKVSIAPFLYRPTYTPLAEVRFQVGQKDAITTFGAGWKWNPFSPRSKRGGALWMGLFGNLPTYP